MGNIENFVIAAGGEGKRISNYFKKINFTKSKSLFPIDGKALLGYLVDGALKLKFINIFILTSFYDEEIKNFINGRYKFENNIFVITGGQKGKVGGVTYVISLLKEKLNKPFIYSDGNVLYSLDLLKRLSSRNALKGSLVNIAISPLDCAPTHSLIYVSNNKILNIQNRLEDTPEINIAKKYKSYYSMGVMAIDNKIFNILPEFADMYDFDYVVEHLFKNQFGNNLGMVNFTIYDKNWVCIHDKKDIDNIRIKRYSDLLGS